MRGLRVLLLCACAGLAAAGEAARVLRGPWWWRAPDGAPEIGLAVAGNPALPRSARVGGAEVALAGELLPLPGDPDGAEAVAVLRLPATAAGRIEFALAGRALAIDAARPPATDAAVAVVVAGAAAWPDRAALAAAASAAGREPDTVLILGPGAAARLGSGGWEERLPVAVVAPADPALDAVSGGRAAGWRHGLRVGPLGLPASPDRGRADLALARDLSPWLAYLDAPAGWDPAISRIDPGDVRAVGVLLAACQRLQVPLVLGAGRAGFISEPLALAGVGAVRVQAGGVRYALVAPAPDDGLRAIEAEVALPLEAPQVAVLSADLERLELAIARPGQAGAVRLAWSRGDDPGSGHGDGEAAPFAAELAAAESLATPAAALAIARWTWLTRAALQGSPLPPELAARLRDEAGPAGRALLRRLALAAVEDPRPVLPGDADPQHARDAVLWRMANLRGADAAGWRLQAAASPDPVVLRAILADAARDPARELAPVLVERVRMQADGAPLDADPVDQHRLFAAVFDDVRLSPTLARPWAVALRERVAPLARGPIDRFLARHGAVRPAVEQR
jgi:hypothetical protein